MTVTKPSAGVLNYGRTLQLSRERLQQIMDAGREVVDRIEAYDRLLKVRELHRAQYVWEDAPGTCVECYQPMPCPTRRVIDGVQGGGVSPQ